jgi:hypothetical protein
MDAGAAMAIPAAVVMCSDLDGVRLTLSGPGGRV